MCKYPENVSTTRPVDQIPYGYSEHKINHIEHKHTLCCGKDCMKKICTF